MRPGVLPAGIPFPQARRVCLALILLCLGLAAPASALIQPRLLDWQARLSRLLPEAVRARAVGVSDRLPVTATPEELQAALAGLAPGIPPEPLELFAGIRLLQRKDQTLERFDQRVALYDESMRLLRDYRGNVNEALRLAPEGPAGPAMPPPEGGLPRPEVRPDGFYILRLLPHPRPTTPRSRLRLYLEAAQQDLAALEPRRTEADHARAAFEEATLAWRWHLGRLSERLDPLTGRVAKPVESVPSGVGPPIEQIPPPPPLDLPQLQETSPTPPAP